MRQSDANSRRRTPPSRGWSSIMPLTTTHGFVKKGQFCFNTKAGLLCFNLSNIERKEIKRVLESCNGITTINTIKKESYLSDKDFRKMMDVLLKYQILHPSNKLGTWFHEQSKEDSKYVSTFDANLFKKTQGLKREPSSLTIKTHLNTLLHKRISTRDFLLTVIPEEEIKQILDAMYFLDGVPTVPSGGSFYPLEFHVIALQTGLEKGAYKYKHQTHTFEKVRSSLDERELYFALQEDEMAKSASFIIVVSANLNNQAEKYANRGYRYSLIETGSVVQNAYLKSTELERGIVAYGGFSDSRLKSYLRTNADPLVTLFIGKPGEKKHTTPAINTVHKLIDEYVKKRGIIKKYNVGRFPYKKVKIDGFYSSATYSSDTPGSKRDGFGFGVSYNRNKALLASLAEAVERFYSGEVYYDFVSSFKDLPIAIQPEKLSGLQIPFVDSPKLKWVKGTQITTGEDVAILADQVFYPLAPTQLGYPRIAKASSNGVAAHSTEDAAIEHGLLELIERDAVAMAWYGRNLISELLDLSPELVSSVAFWKTHGYTVRFFDITTDSVPVVMCTFSSKSSFPHFIVGACARYSLAQAADKAFAEAQYAMVAWDHLGDVKMKEENIRKPLEHGMYYAQKKHAHIPLETLNITSEPKKHTLIGFEDIIKKFDPISIFLHKSDNFYVTRVMSEKLCPILFGYGLSVEDHRRFSDLGLSYENDKIHFFP